MKPEQAYDLVIVGSGGGSMAAALAAQDLGLRPVILEKLDRLGGSTSYSGGVWWVPQNHLLARDGIADSAEAARRYLDTLVGDDSHPTDRPRREAFLRAAPRMLQFLAAKGMKLRRPRDPWPDYYDELPGGLAQGRSVMPEPFDLRALGPWADRLAYYPPMKGMPIGVDEFPRLFLFKRTWGGKARAMRFAGLMLKNKLLGRRMATNGTAIQGRMLQIALEAGIPIFTGAAVQDFLVENGVVKGVIARIEGQTLTIRANRGVIVNSGGFSHNEKLRHSASDGLSGTSWTNSNPGDTGEMTEAMLRLGAATANMDIAWWLMTSRHTNGEWPKGAVTKEGRVLPFMHHLDLSLPNLMLVDLQGKRFANESGSYMEIGERMHARHRAAGSCFPAWVIMDQTNRDRYPWGSCGPGQTPKEWIKSGYMKKAASLRELAGLCGISPEGLEAEVARFNGFCVTGRDEDFGRGGRAFDRAHGDPTVGPNPNLGPIAKGPFYAVAIYPGDVGTAGGVVTDASARVLDDAARPIPGLYAVGNTAASPFGRAYPGAGASIAASFTFAWLAAHHAAGSDEPLRD